MILDFESRTMVTSIAANGVRCGKFGSNVFHYYAVNVDLAQFDLNVAGAEYEWLQKIGNSLYGFREVYP